MCKTSPTCKHLPFSLPPVVNWVGGLPENKRKKKGGRVKKRAMDLPRKAEGETVPLLRDTMTLMPVSTKGTEKSMASDLSSLMVNEPTAISAFLYTT